MAASLASFASILKEFYLGPIQDQLNEETLVCDLMEKASVDWNGRQVIIPVHVGRNASVGWRAEGAQLPGNQPVPPLLPGAPGDISQQAYTNLTITAQHLYGRFLITGPAMAAAGKGGANSFVGWVDAEMNRLVNDVKNNCNRTAVSGGECIGFVSARADLVAVAPGVPTNYLFDGDVVKANAACLDGVAGIGPGWDLVRMDTYAVVDQVTPTALPAGGFITLAPANATVFPVDGAGNAIPLAMVSNTVGAGVLAVNYFQLGTAAEPVGIYGNLGLPGAATAGFANFNGAWFGPDRTTLTGGPGAVPPQATNALQCSDGAAVPVSNMISVSTAAVVPARVNIALPTIQTALDRISLASDEQPDTILCNPLQRTRLAAMLQGVVGVAPPTAAVFDVKSKPTTGDGGFSGFAFAGIPIKSSRHVDNGLMLLLNTKSWKMLELESGKFADSDGNTLSRVPGVDAFEGFYKWYYNTVCVRPNSNGVICGLAL